MPTTYYHADADGSATAPYDTWAKAINTADLLESFLETPTWTAGDILYIRNKTPGSADFTETASNWDCSATSGTAIAPLTIIGVKAGTTHEGAAVVYSDWAVGYLSGGADDRPQITMGAYSITLGNYYKIYNIKFSSAAVITPGTPYIFFNCKFYSTKDGGALTQLAGKNYSTVIACEFTGDANAIDHTTGMSTLAQSVMFCYFHSLVKGISCGSGAAILFNTFDTCVDSITLSSATGPTILNNSFRGCTRAIYGTTGYSYVLNNAMATISADGCIWDTQTDMSFFLKNIGEETGGNVADMWHGVATGAPHYDPIWLDDNPDFAGAGDLSLAAGSPALNNALSPVLGT